MPRPLGVVIASIAAAGWLLCAPVGASAAMWRCTAYDSGSQNPGPACGGYTYSGITGASPYTTYIVNDMWNPPGPGWPQTVQADNPGDWQVTAKFPAGNTAVLAYPDIQQTLTTTADTPSPLRQYTTIWSVFTIRPPAAAEGGDYEAAYDMWLGTGSDNYAQEIMIWVDNHGQTPAGRRVATATLYGQRYAVWSTPSHSTVSLVLESNETTGRTHILAILHWLVARGFCPKDSGVNQIDFGWELCSTEGRAETFRVSAYDLKSAG